MSTNSTLINTMAATILSGESHTITIASLRAAVRTGASEVENLGGEVVGTLEHIASLRLRAEVALDELAEVDPERRADCEKDVANILLHLAEHRDLLDELTATTR